MPLGISPIGGHIISQINLNRIKNNNARNQTKIHPNKNENNHSWKNKGRNETEIIGFCKIGLNRINNKNKHTQTTRYLTSVLLTNQPLQ